MNFQLHNSKFRATILNEINTPEISHTINTNPTTLDRIEEEPHIKFKQLTLSEIGNGL